MLAAEEIPEDDIVPPVLRVNIESLKAIMAQLESNEPPTAAMLELMRAR